MRILFRSAAWMLLSAALASLLSGCSQVANAASVSAPAAKGNMVAYTILNDGLYVADAKGNKDTRLKQTDITTQITQLSWSPDGQRILYTWRGLNGDGTEVNKICTINPTGSNDRCLVESTRARFFAPSFAPDSASVIYVAVFLANANENGVYRVSADGAGNRRLIAGAGEYTRPLWTPDGTRIAFNLYYKGQLALITTDADGANATSITSGDDVYNFSWSPDSQSIAFQTLEAGYVIDGKGGNKRKLAYKPASKDTRLRWSPNSTQISYDSDNGSKGRIKLRNIFITDPNNANSANPLQLTNDKYQNTLLSWSADGAYLLFTSNRDGKTRLYVMDINGKNARTITKNEQVREAVLQPS